VVMRPAWSAGERNARNLGGPNHSWE
jgi:hypothetical protein